MVEIGPVVLEKNFFEVAVVFLLRYFVVVSPLEKDMASHLVSTPSTKRCFVLIKFG